MDAAGSSSMTPEPGRKRAKHSKTRNGCSRCKQRHIKCDESKPECTRCLHANLPCPGYEEVTTQAKRVSVQHFRILHDATKKTLLRIAPARESEASTSSTNNGKDDDDSKEIGVGSAPAPLKEQTAIDFFISQTLPTLTKYSPDSKLWTTTTFDRLSADAKIRNAVIAIGLAHQDLRRNYCRGYGPSTVLSHRSGRNQLLTADALDCDRYYNAALAYMRIDISWVKQNVTADRLPVAVACLLFVIYLSLQDRMEEAAVHMHCGLDIICEGGSLFVCASVLHREVYLYFLHLATITWPRYPSAPLSALIQASYALSCHLQELTPLQSLRADFDFYARRLYQYTSIVTRGHTGDPAALLAMKDTLIEEADLLAEKMNAYADLIGVDEEAQAVGTETLDLMFLRLLRARLLIYRLFSLAVGTRYQTSYDRYTADFDDAITLIAQACKTGSNLIGTDWTLFSVNLDIIGITSQSILLCRHPVVRRRAVGVLKICPQRDGLLEAIEVRQIARMIIDFEERGLDMDQSAKFQPVIPEENRLHLIAPIKSEADEILVRMMYRPNGEQGYVERRVKVRKDTYNSVQPSIDL